MCALQMHWGCFLLDLREREKDRRGVEGVTQNTQRWYSIQWKSERVENSSNRHWIVDSVAEKKRTP